MPTLSSSKVYFFFEAPVSLKERTRLKMFIESIFKKEGYTLVFLNYIFCSDKKLIEINRQFLKHDYYTDIVTFQLSEPASPIEGEIYISMDRVRENARIENETLNKEFLRVIFHGVLHLCGYTDKSKKQIKIIRTKEEHYIEKYMKSRST